MTVKELIEELEAYAKIYRFIFKMIIMILVHVSFMLIMKRE